MTLFPLGDRFLFAVQLMVNVVSHLNCEHL